MQEVLVFVPVFRLEPETVRAVSALLLTSWPGSVSVLYQRDNDPRLGGRANILRQYQRGREIFLGGGWDAMLVIESDIIPPDDTLKRLWALEADLAYGVYRFRISEIINVFEYHQGAKTPGSSLSLNPRALRAAVGHGQVDCSGGGLGCVLIKRAVLEAVDFRREAAGSADCDTFFTRDCWQAGYKMRADLGVVCGHVDIDGELLMPDLPEVVPA